MRNLQFSTRALSASPVFGGLIAGPTQDNGNLFCPLDSPDPNAWVRLEGGDGVVMRFLSNGLLLDVSRDLIAALDIASDDAIVSVASLRGDQVFAGTRKGRIFSLAPFQTPFELAVTPTDRGSVDQIIVVRDARLCFVCRNLNEGDSAI